MSGIVLATSDDLFEHRVRRAYEGTLNGELTTWDAAALVGDPMVAAEDIARTAPDVVAVGPAVPVESALELVRAFDHLYPEVTVMLVAEPTPNLLGQALRAGAREVVSPESSDDELRQAIDRVSDAASRRKGTLQATSTTPTAGRVICVCSAKGGAGKTTIATNLTVGLSRIARDDVAIVDLDLQFGDVVTATRLVPDQSILEAVRVGDRLDVTALKAFLTPHEQGFYVLGAPDGPADADEIDERSTARIIGMLADVFPWVVVDTGSGLDEHTLAALDIATDIILVTSTDVPAVRAARKEIELLRALGLGDRRWHVVLNRSDARVGLEAHDIELTIGAPIDVHVPSSRAVPVSVNEGVPVLSGDDRSAVARSLNELVNRIAGVSNASAPMNRSWFGRRANDVRSAS